MRTRVVQHVRFPLIHAGLLLLVVLYACSGPTEPNTELVETRTSAHYVFHFVPGDAIDTTWQERYYEWLVPTLELQPTVRLDYFKYRNRAHLKAVTGRTTNGFAEPGTTRFHTIWPTDNHEGVHTLVILYLGHPPALFNEGVAVAHQTDPGAGILTPRWNGQDLHVLARQLDVAGRLPAISALLQSTDFFRYDTEITYPMAGSFVRYLLDTYGLAPFKAFLRGAVFDAERSVTEARFQAAYGRSVAAAWAEWRSWLQGRNG